MKSNTLKMLALKAKNRMMNKSGFEAKYDSRIKVISNDDSEFVEKVRSVLESEKKSMNPFKYLMDDKRLMKLDTIGRERYLLEITEKYLKAKAVIESERAVS